MQKLQKQPWETVEYTDNPDLPDLEDIEIVTDFLPRPEELIFKEAETEKITIQLDKATVDFFRHKAQELGASYQRMIRNLLNEYVASQRRNSQHLNS